MKKSHTIRWIKAAPTKFKHSLKEHLKHRRHQEDKQRHSSTASDTTQVFHEQVQAANQTLSRSGRSVNQWYRRVSGQGLNMAVKAETIGELPSASVNDDTLTFYVLKEYSRSNSVLIDLQTRQHNLPPALVAVRDAAGYIHENAGVIFLHHRNAKHQNVSPRLVRLVTACRQHPKLNINIVPVTILWGRAPDKEDSLFKLLMADNWQEPSIAKQLFNIGVMGRDTVVQFHPPHDLSTMIQRFGDTDFASDHPLDQPHAHSELEHIQAKSIQNNALLDHAKDTLKQSTKTALITNKEANYSLSLLIGDQLNNYLDVQRSNVLGPDLSDKRNLVDQLIYSPAIRHACQVEATEHHITAKQARGRARGYAYEIVNDYAYPVVQFFDRFLTRLWTQLYDGVDVYQFERVRDLSSDHELVYVPCHRSHMDYLLLAYVIYKRGVSLPYVAAGNNLDVPVIGPMLRRAVAFYIRRSFKDNKLYKAVLKEYLHTLINRNTPIEYFIEGGRSRSGRLLPPKLGMLAMTVHSQLRNSKKPVVFIPVYIGYERIMESGSYISELKGKPKESESFAGLLKAGRHIGRLFGMAYVNFGTPLHLDEFMQKFEVPSNSLPADRTDTPFSDNATAMIDNLSVKIMQNINKAAVLNPINLLSLVLLSAKNNALDESRCLTELALYQNLADALPYSEDIQTTDMSPADIIAYGIHLNVIERTPHVFGDMIRIAPRQAATLSYFRNNVLHLFILLAFVAALISRNGRIKRQQLDRIVLDLYPFLQSELFLYRAARNVADAITQIIDCLIKLGLVTDLGNEVLGAPESNSDAFEHLTMLSSLVEQSLERYFMTLALLAQQGSGQLTTKQVVDLCHLLGQRLSTLYSDDMPDFFDKALFISFIATLKRLDYVAEADAGMLSFDERIGNIADHARYVLTPDVMQVLNHVASLDAGEIERAIDELNQSRSKRFRKRG